MNNIFIFDVDGTLTPSRREMTQRFGIFFSMWSMNNKFYLVSGSDLDKIKEQVPWYILERAEGVFTCGGNKFYTNLKGQDVDAQLEYENKFKPPQNLLTYLGLQVRLSETPVMSTNHREDRGSMLNFSVVGRDCTLEERQKYFEWDNQVGERERIAQEIKDGWPELDAVIGGQVSIDIAPIGNDKSQILEHIESDFEIPFGEQQQYIFIGDRTMEGGNDYPLAKYMKKNETLYGVHAVEDYRKTWWWLMRHELGMVEEYK